MNIGQLVTKLIPGPFFVEALRVVAEAALKFGDNAERRQFAVDTLAHALHVPEHLARVLVELAVLSLKHSTESAATSTE